MTKNRMISFNKEDNEIVTELFHSRQFRGLNLVEVFALAMVFGKKMGYRTPLEKKKIRRISQRAIENSKVHFLMIAIGVLETGSSDILDNKDDYFTICEEYAKTGLPVLKMVFLDNVDSFVMDLEKEALDYFDFLEEQREFL